MAAVMGQNQSVSLFERKTPEEAAKLKAMRISTWRKRSTALVKIHRSRKSCLRAKLLLNCKPPRSTILTFGRGLKSPDGHFNATILGADGAGIVIQVALGVKGLSTGDNVCLYPLPVAVNASFVSPAGTLCASCKEFGGVDWMALNADYVKLPARTVLPRLRKPLHFHSYSSRFGVC